LRAEKAWPNLGGYIPSYVWHPLECIGRMGILWIHGVDEPWRQKGVAYHE